MAAAAWGCCSGQRDRHRATRRGLLPSAAPNLDSDSDRRGSNRRVETVTTAKRRRAASGRSRLLAERSRSGTGARMRPMLKRIKLRGCEGTRIRIRIAERIPDGGKRGPPLTISDRTDGHGSDRARTSRGSRRASRPPCDGRAHRTRRYMSDDVGAGRAGPGSEMRRDSRTASGSYRRRAINRRGDWITSAHGAPGRFLRYVPKDRYVPTDGHRP